MDLWRIGSLYLSLKPKSTTLV